MIHTRATVTGERCRQGHARKFSTVTVAAASPATRSRRPNYTDSDDGVIDYIVYYTSAGRDGPCVNVYINVNTRTDTYHVCTVQCIHTW